MKYECLKETEWKDFKFVRNQPVDSTAVAKLPKDVLDAMVRAGALREAKIEPEQSPTQPE